MGASLLGLPAGMAQHSDIARSAIMTNAATDRPNGVNGAGTSNGTQTNDFEKDSLMPPPKYPVGRGSNVMPADGNRRASKDGVGAALSDTPMPTAPSSPQM